MAINQTYAATKWVAENGGEIKVDGRRLAVVGNSVGGNMAAVVALMAKDRGGPAIRFQVLMWPVTDANFETGSYNEFADGQFLTRNMMKWFWDNYTTDASERKEIYASPLRAMMESSRACRRRWCRRPRTTCSATKAKSTRESWTRPAST